MKYIEVDRLGTDDDTILTFTNERVNDYNEKIRGYYLKRKLGYVPEIHETDLFVVQDTTDKFQNSETIDLKSFIETDFNIQGKVLKGYKCSTSGGRTYNLVSKDYRDEFNKIIDMLYIYASEKKSKKIWENYYKIKEFFLNVKYQYSSTIHRSQGSTMTNVYVDCSRLDGIDSDLLNRLFYVGVSRASNEVNILL
jgi:hypothetical protein